MRNRLSILSALAAVVAFSAATRGGELYPVEEPVMNMSWLVGDIRTPDEMAVGYAEIAVYWTDPLNPDTDGDDWNGGSGGRYYASVETQSSVIRRLLMYGVGNGTESDIPSGDVYGLNYTNSLNAVENRVERHWRLSLTSVGVDSITSDNPESL